MLTALLAMASLNPVCAFAQASGLTGGPGIFMNLMPFFFMAVVFYFLIIRPQARKQKELQQFLASLKHGDNVIAAGGLLGVIREIQGTIVTLEISQGVRVKVLRSQISQSAESALTAEVKT